ncbi:MAG: ROK family protein [Candidatus Coatesbacteria bacterium]|nr:ROK family protein [Candidatus Coatesbacteria bacterium]
MYIGIDLGGTSIKAGIVTLYDSNVYDHKNIPTPISEGKEAVLEAIYDLIKTFDLSEIKGIGIGSAGSIDPETRDILYSPNLFHDLFPLGTFLREKYEIPVMVENDVRVAALAEHHYYYKSIRNFICIYLGTGIGSGIIVDGKLLSGCSNAAGEVGHMVINARGSLCACGNNGCFEAEASGQGVLRKARKALESERKGLLFEKYNRDKASLLIRDIKEAALKGDPLASNLWEEFIFFLSLGISNIMTIFNPEVIVLGGGVLESNPEIIDEVIKQAWKSANPVSARTCSLTKVNLGKKASILGAGLLFLEY